MDATTLTIIWILVIAVIVGLVAWFGPRPLQWRHEEADESVGTGISPKKIPTRH